MLTREVGRAVPFIALAFGRDCVCIVWHCEVVGRRYIAGMVLVVLFRSCRRHENAFKGVLEDG